MSNSKEQTMTAKNFSYYNPVQGQKSVKYSKHNVSTTFNSTSSSQTYLEYTPNAGYQKNLAQDRNKSAGRKKEPTPASGSAKSSIAKNKSVLSKSFCPKFSLGNLISVRRVERTPFDSANNTISISPTRNVESQGRFSKSRKTPTETIPEDSSAELTNYEVLVDEFKESYESFIAGHMVKVKKAFSKELGEVKESLERERLKNEKLEQENIKLTKEYESQCTLINSQKKLIKDLQLKMQSEDTKQRENLLLEIDRLTQENGKLELQIKRLTEELGRSKEQEAALERLIKSNSFVTTCTDSLTTKENEALKSKSNNTAAKQPASTSNSTKGKTKKPNVVVPRLDFSKLPQKEQAKFKVIQCEASSISSAEDIIEEPHNLPEHTSTKQPLCMNKFI
eukprot:TRINITY_DN4047_c0_g1_i1.p1 TRINITY_DN4047_c0_g1~~TRINITY_DN4047_c0_g1_i1.p1  ORF type:complete len:394 (-),score=114.56 TRINITY_DN4047_c0_g1_i1:42-1223(-)